jgi:protein transport protein HofC/type IV pilus assembly protein PilC
MPWYKIKHHNGEVDYRYELSERKVIFDFINRGYWQISISKWKPRKLDYRSLQTFYKEIQSALQSGLQLNQGLSHFALSSAHPTIATTSKAILSELENGTAFNKALGRLTNTTAKPYCKLINSQGSREDCEKSLSISIIQLSSLLDWSQRLLKAIIYPFSVIQIALIILIVNRALQQKAEESYFFDLINDLSLYFVCSAIQIIILRSLHQGQACYWLEKYSENFRLTKLFSLLSTTRKTGITLQHALRSMPEYFQYTPIKEEIYQVYYTLRLGKNYAASFPASWFPHESAIALHSAEQDGDIERALTLAAKEHEKRWQKNITLLEKLIPAVCLLVAGGFVASALVALYAPLIEMS